MLTVHFQLLRDNEIQLSEGTADQGQRAITPAQSQVVSAGKPASQPCGSGTHGQVPVHAHVVGHSVCGGGKVAARWEQCWKNAMRNFPFHQQQSNSDEV